ncbi:uncharacterized protein [Phyllobates terribilis]|uniref:uncharacterized protein n=1 Tax=Phyllobates terribilis TaxID=111132 RepID=UPI003CCA81A7
MATSCEQSIQEEDVRNRKMDAYYLHRPLDDKYGYKEPSINTLFVSGLPDDVKPREIHNLFRRRPGFDSCQLKYTGRANQVVAFVTFFNHQSAVAALNTLDGVQFDPQAGSFLHIELARSNSRRKRKPGGGPYVVIDKRRRTQDDIYESSEEVVSMILISSCFSGKATTDPEITKDNNCHKNKEKNYEGDTQECSTLFIANLGPNCTEEELRQRFTQYPGFNVLKLRARYGMPVAFVDFEEVKQATNAMNVLQGSSLSSSDRGGMHIEYARSKMRKT